MGSLTNCSINLRRLVVRLLSPLIGFLPAFAFAIEIQSVDYDAVPVGEKIAVRGDGFTDVTRVTFLWSVFHARAAHDEVDDETLRVTFPVSSGSSFANTLLVETASGSALGLDEERIVDFTGTGTFDGADSPPNPHVVVHPGAVLTGLEGATVVNTIYVKSAGVFRLDDVLLSGVHVFLEDGATLDLRQAPPIGNGLGFFYSPSTTVLGEDLGTATFARKLAPLSLSRGIGPFTQATTIDLEIDGSGSVAFDPPGPYYRSGTTVRLTAIDGDDAFFDKWGGELVSFERTETVPVFNSPISVTASFLTGRRLTVYNGGIGDVMRTPSKALYDDQEEVVLTAAPPNGYRFQGWGGDADQVEGDLRLVMDNHKTVVAIFEPEGALLGPRVLAVDHVIAPVGENILVSGSGFTGTTRVTFLSSIFHARAIHDVVDDGQLDVVYPASQGSRNDNLMLLETGIGSTAVLDDEGIVDFTRVGTFDAAEYPGSNHVVVHPGSVLSGFETSSGINSIYVRSGAVLILDVPIFGMQVFLEDGATLDLQQRPSIGNGLGLFLSPRTAIAGGSLDGASHARAVSSLSLSRGIGPFTSGTGIDVHIVGDGTVRLDPPGPYYRSGTDVRLTAAASDSAFFAGWSGGLVSSLPSEVVRVFDTSISITGTFLALPATYSEWVSLRFNSDELSEDSISGLEANPDKDDLSNLGEYAFGGNPKHWEDAAAFQVQTIDFVSREVELSYERARSRSDISYVLSLSHDLTEWVSASEYSGLTFSETERQDLPLGRERISLRLGFEDPIGDGMMLRLTARYLGD